MYDFHYNYIQKTYPDGARLLFTDTDSLTYHIKTEDVYHDFLADRELFDNSDYPQNSKFYFSENKKVIGKFKDETAGVPIKEFIGLKCKIYSIFLDNECNGVQMAQTQSGNYSNTRLIHALTTEAHTYL